MKTFVYTAQIPTGEAKTRGWGKTCDVYVIRCERPENFKTRNSLTVKRVGPYKWWRVGRARFDYGLQRGASKALLDKAERLAAMVTPPEPRSTLEEF